jgi:hypothetical protein
MKTATVEKEPIRFKRFEGKPETKPIYYQSSEKNITTSNGQYLTVAASDESTKANDKSGRRESAITERKVYASPITRYELNRQVEEVSNMMDSSGAKRYSLSNSLSFEAKNIRY